MFLSCRLRYLVVKFIFMQFHIYRQTEGEKRNLTEFFFLRILQHLSLLLKLCLPGLHENQVYFNIKNPVLNSVLNYHNHFSSTVKLGWPHLYVNALGWVKLHKLLKLLIKYSAYFLSLRDRITFSVHFPLIFLLSRFF